MSIWPWLGDSGVGSQASLPQSLQLDLARLKKVVSEIGDIRLALKLLRLRSNPDEQLRQINHFLGSQLERSTPEARYDRAAAFPPADDVLPLTMKETATRPSASDSVFDVGCADLGRMLNDSQVEAIHAHLHTKPVLLGHIPHSARGQVASLDRVPSDGNYACYNYLDLWSSPGLMQFATQDKVLDLAQAYLGCTPTLYSINAFWSLPNREAHKATQVFHRDWEDYRSLALFTQLTPVDVPEDGAHYYVETSHDLRKFEHALRQRGVAEKNIASLSVHDERVIAPLAIKMFQNSARRFDGPAGQSFCTDGYGLHRAEVPRTRPRLLLWFRFGNFFNSTMFDMRLGGADAEVAARILADIPDTPRHRYVFRYLVQSLTSVVEGKVPGGRQLA
jgi:hypothetical protein